MVFLWNGCRGLRKHLLLTENASYFTLHLHFHFHFFFRARQLCNKIWKYAFSNLRLNLCAKIIGRWICRPLRQVTNFVVNAELMGPVSVTHLGSERRGQLKRCLQKGILISPKITYCLHSFWFDTTRILFWDIF